MFANEIDDGDHEQMLGEGQRGILVSFQGLGKEGSRLNAGLLGPNGLLDVSPSRIYADFMLQRHYSALFTPLLCAASVAPLTSDT